MALTIEDGTGVDGADSFVTTAEYEADMLSLFGETVVADEPPIRRAYLFLMGLSWKSEFAFPTLGGSIPAAVKHAQNILARYEAATPSGLSPTVIPGQQKILTKVGEIGWTPTGQSGVDAQRAVVTMAMDLLAPYISGTGSTQFLQRA